MRRILGRVDRWQRRHALGGFPVAVFKKFSEDRASNLAALVAYYAFFSLFPLLLVFTTVVGFVLADDPQAQKDILDSTLQQIPLAGEELKTGTL
jgi:membrane protein